VGVFKTPLEQCKEHFTPFKDVKGFFQGFCNLPNVVIIYRKYFSQIWLHNIYIKVEKKKQNPSILKFGIFKIWNLVNLGHFSHEKSFGIS